MGKTRGEVAGTGRRRFIGIEEAGEPRHHVATHGIRDFYHDNPPTRATGVTEREADSTPASIPRHSAISREAVFARDHWCCVYCGTEGTPETLSVDHVQPRMRGGDHSAGNVVTACLACNARKAHRSHAEFLASEPEAWQNFRQRAGYVWPRHLAAVEAQLARQGQRKPRTPRERTQP